MIKPLSLRLPKETQMLEVAEMCSPSLRNRADSLVFSATSEKYYSPKDTMLMDSKQHEVSRQLETLQLKIENLESRVERIDSENCTENVILPNKYNQGYFIEIEEGRDPFSINKQNSQACANRVGKIVKKDKELNKTTKIERDRLEKRKLKIETIATSQSRQSRNSHMSEDAELFVKMKELSLLRKEVSTIKNSMQKTQRSKSICSERLSASKNMIKSLKKDEKKQNRIADRLRADLKKSENIRQKQKQIISKQQAELSYYRQLFKALKADKLR